MGKSSAGSLTPETPKKRAKLGSNVEVELSPTKTDEPVLVIDEEAEASDSDINSSSSSSSSSSEETSGDEGGDATEASDIAL